MPPPSLLQRRSRGRERRPKARLHPKAHLHPPPVRGPERKQPPQTPWTFPRDTHGLEREPPHPRLCRHTAGTQGSVLLPCLHPHPRPPSQCWLLLWPCDTLRSRKLFLKHLGGGSKGWCFAWRNPNLTEPENKPNPQNPGRDQGTESFSLREIGASLFIYQGVRGCPRACLGAGTGVRGLSRGQLCLVPLLSPWS